MYQLTDPQTTDSNLFPTRKIRWLERLSQRFPRLYSFIRRMRKDLPFLIMASPGVLAVFIFAYLPMFGIIIAFKDYRAVDGILGSKWVWFQNFIFLFASRDAWRITTNTLFMNTLFILSSLLVSLSLALLLNELKNKYFAAAYKSALFFPYLLSWVVISYISFAFLSTDNGVLNSFLAGLGVKPIRWYASPQYWPVILTVVSVWKSAGVGAIIYLSGMLAINPEYFEAAKIDGASKWQQIIYITLPLIQPLIIINVMLAIGRIFYADFGMFFNVTRDSKQLYATTDVIDTYVYRALRVSGDVGMAAAAGLYQAVVGFVLVLLSNLLVRHVDKDKAIF